MQTAKFYGSSDDLVEVEGIKGGDEFDGDDIWFVVTGSGGSMRVAVRYDADGCWSVGVAPVDEGVPMPNWPMRVKLAASGYTPVLEMDCPDDAAAIRVHRKPT